MALATLAEGAASRARHDCVHGVGSTILGVRGAIRRRISDIAGLFASSTGDLADSSYRTVIV
jgi:hypothetical protein